MSDRSLARLAHLLREVLDLALENPEKARALVRTIEQAAKGEPEPEPSEFVRGYRRGVAVWGRPGPNGPYSRVLQSETGGIHRAEDYRLGYRIRGILL